MKEVPSVTNVGQVYVNKPTGVTVSTTADPSTSYKDTEINFSASTTTPENVTISEYKWKFGDGTTKTTTSPNVTHSYGSIGEYDYSVTVVDSTGNETTAGSTVTIIREDQPGWYGTGTADYVVTLEGSSTTPVGETYTVTANVTNVTTENITKYEWSIDGATYTTSTNTLEYTFTQTGEQRIYARAIDESGEYSSDKIDVTVEENSNATIVTDSLQDAINNSSSGDVLIVDGGNYSGINVHTDITLIGESGASINSVKATASATVSGFNLTDTVVVESGGVTIKNSYINSTSKGIYTYNIGGFTLVNSTVEADAEGLDIYVGPHGSFKNFKVKTSELRTGGTIINGSSGTIKNAVISDSTLRTDTQIVGRGIRPRGTGTITVEKGSGAAELVSASLNGGTASINSTAFSSGQNTARVPDGYFQNQSSINLFGSGYTVTSSIPLDSQVSVYANGAVLDGVNITETSGTALLIKSSDTVVKNSEMRSQLYIGDNQNTISNTTVRNTTIKSSQTGVYTENINYFTLTNSVVESGGKALYFDVGPHGTRKNYTVANSELTSTNHTIVGGPGTLENVIIEDSTINTDAKIVGGGLRPRGTGTLTVEAGSGAAELVSASYDGGTATFNNTTLTDGQNTVRVPDGYFQNQSALRLYGSNYTVESTVPIASQLRVRGSSLTISGLELTKSTGDALRIYSSNTRVENSKLSSRLYVGASGVTVTNTTINSPKTAVYTDYINHFTLVNSKVDADGKAFFFDEGKYGTAKNFTIRNSNITSVDSTVNGGSGTIEDILIDGGTISTNSTIYGGGTKYPTAQGNITVTRGDDAIEFGTTAYTTEQNVTIMANDTLETNKSSIVFTFPTGFLDNHSTITVRGAEYTLYSEEAINNTIDNKGTNVTINVTR